MAKNICTMERENIKHEYPTFWKFMLFYQIMDYRDTRAYILDPCIQGILIFFIFHKCYNAWEKLK